MPTNNGKPDQAADLRRRAEAVFQEKAAQSPDDVGNLSTEATRQLAHELRVHQIELQMQNEELRRAQTELDTERARYFDLYDLAPVGYVTVSEQGLILEANLAAATLLGLARSALVKQPISRFILKEDQDVYYQQRKRLFETGAPQECELRMVKNDGSSFWAHLVSTDAKSEDDPSETRIVISDVSERKRSEEALRESEERYHTVADFAYDWEYWLAPDGKLKYVSPACERVTGYRAEEFMQDPGLMARIAHPDDVDLLQDHLDDCGEVTPGITHHGLEFRIINRGGDVRWISHVCQRVYSHAGIYLGRRAGNRDTTEHKALAEQTARLEDQMRQVQKMEAIGQLAGGVAHDFNNLTAIVLGYGEMLLNQLGPENPSRKYVEQIVAAGRRSATLTRQLLAFGRRQTLQPEVLDLNALLHNLDIMLNRLIGEDIHLEFTLDPDLGCVTADAGQLEQVVTNLVINARDAMPKGGRLTVETVNVELDLLSQQSHESVVPGKYVLLALTDTGCGMDKATMGRLFEPFFTTKEKGKGTGLGLATAYGIVKQSGGYINASSEPGVGTTFKIYLPRTDAQPRSKATDSAGEVPRGGELILLVEDEAPLRELCKIVLSELGYRVSAATGGPEALRLVLEQGLAPDLILTDVIMPGMSGTTMMERLRSNRPSLKVLYMSGYPDDAIAPHGALDPGTNFIQKPFRTHALAAKIRESLAGKTVAQAVKHVLMIDDDERFLDMVRHFCIKRGHVFAGVDSAAAAIKALAGHPCDVLLIDLNIPGTSGEQVLREIRGAGYAAPAIVLTGDIASADMGVLRPLGAVRALEKSSEAAPLLQAVEAAVR